MSGAPGNRVEVVRGALDEETSAQIMAFWGGRGMLADEAAARSQLPRVVSVLRTSEGELAGVNSALAERVAMIGARPFWIYRSALAPACGDEDFFAMLSTCFVTLADEFADSGTGPVGVCVPVGDAGLLERHPEVVWPQSGFLYAGYFPNGRQIRIRYFEDARI